MTVEVIFRPLAPTEEEIRFLESHYIHYPKAKRKEFARIRQLKLATLQDVERLQQLTGPLPADYVDFLMTQNGGRPNPSSCKAVDGKRYEVNELLALSFELKFYSNVNNYLMVFDQRIPKESLPIGSSPGGDLFLLDLRPETLGAVLYWRHELEDEDDGSHFYGNVREVAKSFTEFLGQFFGEKTAPRP